MQHICSKTNKQKQLVLFSIFILVLTNFILFNNASNSSTQDFNQTLPYQREFKKDYSLKEKFELANEYFLYINPDYETYFPLISWDESTNFIEMPTKLQLVKNDKNQIILENTTSFLDEELTLFKLLYDLEEEALHQEELVANGQEFYEFERYDEISLKINEQAELIDELMATRPNQTDDDEKEINSHTLLAFHLLTTQANDFDTFIHELHQWQSFLVDYLERMQLYAQIILTDVEVDSVYLEELKQTVEETLNNMYVFYQTPLTYEKVLLGKLEFESNFDTSSNQLTSRIIFNYNHGQYEEEFEKILDSITITEN